MRLNAAGRNRQATAKHTHRSYASSCTDLKRWTQRGLDGLADAPATNQPEKIAPEIRAFLHQKLQQQRTWTCTQLIETVEEHYGIRVGREAMRLRLLQFGYCWKRIGYVPYKGVDPEVLREHQASLETLKRGRSKTG